MKKVYSLIQKIVELKFKTKNCGKILMFHQVSDKENNWVEDNISIRLENFKKLIDNLALQNAKFITPNELDSTTSRNFVLLTFDDVFSDAMDFAATYLIEKEIPFTIFVCINFLDKEGYISKAQLMDLVAQPLCTIGCHSLNHSVLRKLSISECEKELCQSKRKLEVLVDREVQYLAYPYGSVYACGKREARIAERLGYRLAFSTLQSGINKRSKKKIFFLPRFNVNNDNYGRYCNVK